MGHSEEEKQDVLFILYLPPYLTPEPFSALFCALGPLETASPFAFWHPTGFKQ